MDQAEQIGAKIENKRPSSRRNSVKPGEKQRNHKKSINLNNGNRAKLRLPRASSNLSNTLSQLKFMEPETDKNSE